MSLPSERAKKEALEHFQSLTDYYLDTSSGKEPMNREEAVRHMETLEILLR